MNLAIILVIAAAVALGVILRLAITQSLQAKRNAKETPNIRPIDLQAFQNLIDPAEDEYLRAARQAQVRLYTHAAVLFQRRPRRLRQKCRQG